jgi:hypothetical protein
MNWEQPHARFAGAAKQCGTREMFTRGFDEIEVCEVNPAFQFIGEKEEDFND